MSQDKKLDQAKTPQQEAMEAMGHRYATLEEVLEVMESTRERCQPVLDYLKDK
jgi:hypothetical protein